VLKLRGTCIGIHFLEGTLSYFTISFSTVTPLNGMPDENNHYGVFFHDELQSLS